MIYQAPHKIQRNILLHEIPITFNKNKLIASHLSLLSTISKTAHQAQKNPRKFHSLYEKRATACHLFLTQTAVWFHGLCRLAFAVANFAPVVNLDGAGSLHDIGDVPTTVNLSTIRKR